MRRLQHHTQTRMDRFQREPRVVPAADADLTSGGFIKASQQVDDGALATAGRSNQCDRFPPLDQQ